MSPGVSNPLVTGLSCLVCGTEHEATLSAQLCMACEGSSDHRDPGILDVQYRYEDVELDRGRLARDPGVGLRRFAPVLPTALDAESLPAGGTPLVPAPRLAAALGADAVWLKDETRNPTRCLKDRATAIAMALAGTSAQRHVYCASAGNAAISLAGFSAHMGFNAHVFVPRYASRTRLDWLTRYGADVHVSGGDYDQAFDESVVVGMREGWFSRNCAVNPYLVEGKKTVAYEIAEQLRWTAPDVVITPVGDGCTLGAIGKGFRECELLELTSGRPLLVGVQAAAVPPIVERSGSRWQRAGAAKTDAASIAVRRPRNAVRVMREVAATNGYFVSVDDEEIGTAQADLAAKAGMVCEFTSAATFAAARRLARENLLQGRVVVLVITGGRIDEPQAPPAS